MYLRVVLIQKLDETRKCFFISTVRKHFIETIAQVSFEYHHLPFPALFKFVISFDITQPQFHWPLQDLGLQSPAQEGRLFYT